MLSSEKPFGLKNLGNSCYMNSILQCLFLCEDFNNEILNAGSKLELGSLANKYKTIIRTMIQRSNEKSKINIFKITNFIKTYRKEFGVGMEQQDSHETLLNLINNFHDTLKIKLGPKLLKETVDNMRYTNNIKNEIVRQITKIYENEYSIVNKYFYGHWNSIIECSSCKYKINRIEVIKGLELSIDSVDNVEDAIEEYFSSEKLEGYRCDKCKKIDTSSKKYVLLNTPQYLFIQLKRFTFDWETESLNKNTDLIEAENYLNFKKYLLKRNSNKKIKDIDLYKLKSVVNHIGSMNGGHYYTYTHFKNRWIECDDKTIRFLEEDDDIITENSYILLYEKVKSD